ncbi:MAG: LamG-like jellyroll fold domain-containing protein [[Clostridium] leptum]
MNNLEPVPHDAPLQHYRGQWKPGFGLRPEQAVDNLLGLGDAVEISADCGRYVIEDPEPGKVYILTLCAVDAEGKCSEGVTGFYSTGDYSAVPEESLLWLSAGDQVTVDGQGRVSSWESLGDSGISAEQPEQEAQPVLVEDAYGGQPVIRFDGVDDTMSFDLDLDGKSAVTIIAVSAYQGTETGTGDQNCLVYFDEDGSWGKTFVSPLADAISWRYGSGQENNNNVYQRESGAGNEFSVTAVVKDSAEESLFVDGKKVMTQTGKNAVLANNVAEGRLCSYYFGYEDHFTQYDLAELMIFDRALSDEEIGNIQAYLNLKYETDLDKVASGISLENPEYPDKGLKLPEMPRGIELAIESSDPEGVIGADGSITWPEQETKVNVVCRVTNTLTKESVLTDSFELTLTPVVKADLSAAIAAAEGKQEAGYTPETWEPFAEALEYAKAVLADKNAAQAQVDEAMKALTEKMAALAETAGTSSKPGDSSSKPDTSRPGDISNPDDSSSKGGTSQNGQNTPQTGDQFYPGVFIVLIGGCLLSSAAYVLIKQRGHNS